MKCPNCGVEAPAGATDCPSCGVIFEKFKKKLDSLPPPTPLRFPRWLGRVIAVVIVLAWFAGFGLYYRGVLGKLPQKPRVPAPVRRT